MFKAQYSTLLVCLALGAVVFGSQMPATAFRTAEVGGQWRLRPPSGPPGLIRALDHVQLTSPGATPVEAMRRAGFNAVGADSDAELWHRGLPYVESLHLGGQLAAEQQNDVVDVYASGFAAQVQDLVEAAVRPRLHDGSIIGYFSDGGLDWAPHRHPTVLLATYLQLPWSEGGRAAVVDFLRARYNSNITALRRAWGVKAADFTTLTPPPHPNSAVATDAAAFATQVLARYLSVIAASLHRDDPNHLFFGAALSYAPSAGLGSIWSIADVASVRLLPGQNAAAVAASVARMTLRPIWMEVPGCGAPAPGLTAMLENPRLIGYAWDPAGDWQSGSCAAATRNIWAPLNRRAAMHSRAH